MVNLGIDFGSTYTMVSVVSDGKPTIIESNMNSYHYPSLVCYDKRKKDFIFGQSARNRLGKQGVTAYRGFKMLLAQERNQAQLKERGYTGKNTPEYITELFLEHVISESLDKLKEDTVGLLVIGAPECWFQSLQMVDARGSLRRIVENIRKRIKIRQFELRSEPTDAAAFCVWKSEQEKSITFNGKLMVIDYGGGTLDTTLVSVEHIANKIQIRPEILSGIGENQDKEIGKAGIAYQEAVVRRAISDACGITENSIPIDVSFDKAVKSFEDDLLAQYQDVNEVFGDSEGVSEDSLDEFFTEIEYNDETVEITFAQMKKVYESVIAPSLDKVLRESTAEMPANERPYLALVGGFCNFYLVHQQIQEFFKLGSISKGTEMISFTSADSEKAIAFGASLLANKAVEVCHVAGFGIGMAACYNGVEGEYFMRYAINYGQEYIPNRIYIAKDDDQKIATMILSQADMFLLNFSKNPENGKPVIPKAEFAKKLRNATQDIYFAVVGFSIDEAERITVHFFDDCSGDSEDDYNTRIKCNKKITLETFKESFNNILFVSGGDKR